MSKEQRAQIENLQGLIKATRKGVHEAGDNITIKQANEANERIADLLTLLSETITDGANLCPECDGKPHGMVHEMAVKGESRPIYEIGCLPCKDVRAIDLLPELALERWNAGSFEAPSSGPGVRLDSETKAS